MDAQGHGVQPTSAARLSPVASTSSYFLQLDSAGRIEIMDSSMVQSSGGTRTIELGSNSGGGGDETVYEIRDDDYTFLSGQFMEQGLQEIDPVDITDLLDKPLQSYTVEESNNSHNNSTFTTLTSAGSVLPQGYEGISIMDTSGRIHHQQSFSAGSDSLLSVSNNQMSSLNTSYSATTTSSGVVLCANTFPLTNVMNSSNVQLLSHHIPISSMNCDILDPNQLNARVVVSSSHETMNNLNKSSVVISEPIQIMQQGVQHPIAVIHVSDLTEQNCGTSQNQDLIMSQGQQSVQHSNEREINLSQASDDEVKIVYGYNQNSQLTSVQPSSCSETEASCSQPVSVISEVNSSNPTDGDMSSQTTVESTNTEEDEEDEENDEMTIKIVSCYSQRSESEIFDASSKSSLVNEEIDKIDETDLAPSSTSSVVSKDPVLVRKRRVPPWLSCCVDKDDELLLAYNNRPLKDCSKTSLCGFCYEWEDNEETLQEHIKSKHNKLRLHECGTCGARFIARILLKRHQKLHIYDLDLPWSRYVTDNLDPFSVKTSNHFTRRFRPAPFSDAYREHITDVLERIQSLQYDCFDCGESFEDEELARDHYEYFHAIHTCRHCEKVLDNWEDFINHKQSSHGEYSIHENYIGGAWFLWEHWLCEESVKRENIISNVCYFHNYAEVKEKESSVYEEEFVDSSTLIDEAQSRETDLKLSKDYPLSESENTLDSSLYNSDSTGEDTETSGSVNQQQSIRRRVKKRTQEELNDEMYSATTLAFKCDQCPKSYDNEHDLKRHGRCHTIDKQPLTCQYCQKSFKTHSHKKEHERTHTGEKPYTCPICNRSFIQSSNLKKHIQTHKSENTLQCKICNKQFIKESSLVLHQRAHALDRKFRCEVCDRAYNYASLLKRHMRIHTGELPYSCDVCGMLFHELVSLHYHRKKIHTGERPHKCDVCGRAFILSSDLKKHHQIHTKSPSDRMAAPKISRRRSQIKSIESDSSRNDGETIMEQDDEDSELSSQNSVSIMEVPITQASVIIENHNVVNHSDETSSPKKEEEGEKEAEAMQDLERNSNLNQNEEDNPNPTLTQDATKPKPPILRVYQKGPPKKQSIIRSSPLTPRIAPAPIRTHIPVIQSGPTVESAEKHVSVIQHSYTPNVTNVTLSQNLNTTSDVSFVQLSSNGDQASYVIVSYDGVSMMAIPQSAVSDSTSLHLQDSTSLVPVTNSQNNDISQPFQTQILDGQQTDVYATSFDTVMSGTNDKNFQNMEIMQTNICEQKPNDVDIMNDFNNIIVEAPDVSEEVTVNECDSLMAWE